MHLTSRAAPDLGSLWSDCLCRARASFLHASRDGAVTSPGCSLPLDGGPSALWGQRGISRVVVLVFTLFQYVPVNLHVLEFPRQVTAGPAASPRFPLRCPHVGITPHLFPGAATGHLASPGLDFVQGVTVTCRDSLRIIRGAMMQGPPARGAVSGASRLLQPRDVPPCDSEG